MCLLAVGITAKAESVTITANMSPSPFADGSGYREFKTTFDGITLQGRANNNSGIALEKGGGYLAITENAENYTISTVIVKAKQSGTKATTLTANSSDVAYVYSTANTTSWIGSAAGSHDVESKDNLGEYSYNVYNNYFVLYNSTSNGAIYISEIVINYEKGASPKMHFDNQVVYGKVNTGVVWQQVIVDEPSTTGTITYTSSDTEIVEVESSTGRILPSGVKKSGVVTITATREADGEYATGNASYQITVVNPDEKQSGNTIFDFTTVNPYGITTQTSATQGKYEKDMTNPVTTIVGDNGIVTLSFDGYYRSWGSGNSFELRLNKSSSSSSNTITIYVPDGYKITKIGITGAGTNATYNPVGSSDVSTTWEPTQGKDENEVVINANEALKISKINVLWDETDTAKQPAQLTFTPNVNGIIVGEKWTINAVNNPNNREITYSIPALDEANVDYSITPIDDGKKLEVLVRQPGSYTLQATSPLGDGFRDGFAIMRLNVFRHINVYHENELVEQENIKANASKSTYVTFDVPENAFVYYKLESAADANVATQADEAEDENLEPGFTQYEDGVEIPANHNGALHFYIANYGYKSPVRKLNVSVATGVSEVEAAAEGEVKYYDLSGREVKGQPEQGIYIRLQGGKAEKVLVK